MKTRQRTKTLLRSKSHQYKSKGCKKCGSYHHPCLCVLEKKKKREDKKKKSNTSSKGSKSSSSSNRNVVKSSCSCKRGPCNICGSSCRRCGCSCDGDDPYEALKRKPGVHKKKASSNRNTESGETVRNKTSTILNDDVSLLHRRTTSTRDISDNASTRVNVCTDIKQANRKTKPKRMKQQW